MMKYSIVKLLFLVCIVSCSLLAGCSDRAAHRQDADYMLAEMRSDTAYIHELDSLATLALGADANCIDPVWHLFNCNGRRWFHNPDWGGVLEIPEGLVPQDDYIQTELSFHGTSAITDDHKLMLSFYAGYQAETEAEYMEGILNTYRKNGFNVITIDTTAMEFPEEYKASAYTIKATNSNGMNIYGRYIPSGLDKVLFLVALTNQDGHDARIREILPMIDRYPFTVDGSFMKGEVNTFRYEKKN